LTTAAAEAIGLGRQLVDYVGRFEKLQEEYEWITKTIGLSAELSFRNKTLHQPYASYYTDETRDLVAKVYEIDVKSFDYSF
jgi:chondroitin 4-sulfotransferase 11